jgi:hypothetical protein
MSKKIIALFTMVAFIVFSLSCIATKNVRLDADAAQKVKKGGILRVVMTSGETIEFSKDQPGKIHNGSITGTAIRVTGELEKAYIEAIEKNKKGKISRAWVSIPLSEVEIVSFREVDIGASVVNTIGILGIAVLIVGYGMSKSF